MKIQSVIMGCDSNPAYLHFWPLVAECWQTRIGVNPILCYVGDGKVPDCPYGEVVRYPFIEGIPSPFQGQWVRFFHAAQCGNQIVTIADIDILPRPHPLYKEWIADFDDERYLNTVRYRKRFAACFHFAKGSTFKKVWDIPEQWEESAWQVIRHPLAEFDGKKYNYGTDELYTTEKMMAHPQQEIFFHFCRFPPQHNGRISRRLWYYDADLLDKNHYYYAEAMLPCDKYLPIFKAFMQDLPIPRFFYYLSRLLRILRNIRPPEVSNHKFLRFRTRIFYRILYKAYLAMLIHYFKRLQK